MDEPEVKSPDYFHLKKWLVVIAAAVDIALCITYAALINHLIRFYLYEYESFRPDQSEYAKTLMVLTIMMLSALGILFSLFGVLAAVKENLCLTTAYLVLVLIQFIASLANTIVRPYYWGLCVWTLVSALFIFIFLRDLVTMERKRRNLFRAQRERLSPKVHY